MFQALTHSALRNEAISNVHTTEGLWFTNSTPVLQNLMKIEKNTVCTANNIPNGHTHSLKPYILQLILNATYLLCIKNQRHEMTEEA